MKKFLKKRFLGIPLFAILTVLLVGTVALAAWGVTSLTSTGVITVEEPLPIQTYKVDTEVLDFGLSTVMVGGSISVTSADITITNTGNVSISGIAIVVSDIPADLTATPNITGTPIAPGSSATASVTLTGIAPSTSQLIQLSGITATLTPN